jgi:energy-coupling factor transporter ATP-binding protein EcfA2
VIAVDGPSGSGKTTLAARLAHALEAPVVHLDDLYPGWDGLHEGMVRLVDWVLEPLARGATARYRRFDWARSAYAAWHDVPASAVLVVEGVGSGCRAAAPYLTLLAWIEAPLELRMARGIARDGEVYRPHWERWARQEAELFAAEGTMQRADVLVDGAPTIPHDPDTEYVGLRPS